MANRVLCIAASAVAPLYSATRHAWFCSGEPELDQFRNAVRLRSFFVDRVRAEEDPSYVQLIPACIIANGSYILCLQRASNVERAELKSRWTSVFGGHVDEADRDEGDAWITILNGVTREVREELGISLSNLEMQFAGLAIDPTNKTGQRHLGLLFYYAGSTGQVRLNERLDLQEFDVLGTRTVNFCSVHEVRRLQDRFDPWSTLFLQSDFAKRQRNIQSADKDDLPLMRWVAR